MCMGVEYLDHRISSIGELKSLVGAGNVRSAWGEELDSDDNCLCNIDVTFAAASMGCYAKRDSFDWIFIPFITQIPPVKPPDPQSELFS